MVLATTLAKVLQKRGTLPKGDTKWEQIKYITGARGNKQTWHPPKCLATAIV